MDVVLGPNLDLLVWIPKKPNPRTADMCRPLQLPSCLRRLFGAAVAATVGPVLEQRLTADQSSKRELLSRGVGPSLRGAGGTGLNSASLTALSASAAGAAAPLGR